MCYLGRLELRRLSLKSSETLNFLLPRLEKELEDLTHGIVRVELNIRDGRLSRVVVAREESIVIQDCAQNQSVSLSNGTK